MDRKLTAVALVSIVVLSGLGAAGAGAIGDVGAQAGNQPSQSSATVSASGTAEVTAQPDQAVVYLVVSASGENASAATSALAADVSTLRDGLDNESLPVVSVNTTSYHVGPAEQRRGGPGGQGDGGQDDQGDDGDDDRTYVARQTFAVTTDDVSAVGQVVDASVDAGADRVQGVRFTLSEERREELRTQAIDRAVSDARSQAEAAANAAGLSIDGVHAVSVDAGDGPVAFQATEGIGAAGTTIDPSPVGVTARVHVTYNATGN